MAGNNHFQTLKDLEGYTFVIPSQQRGYKWSKDNILALLSDLQEFAANAKNGDYYCMQPLAISKVSGTTYRVLDGQQRLTTFYLINKALRLPDIYSFEFERDTDSLSDKVCEKRSEFLRGDIPLSDESSDLFFISHAYDTIKEWEGNKEAIKELINGNRTTKSIQFLWYEIPAEEEHEVFRNLNSGKIALTNAELIKGLLASDDSIPNKELAITQYSNIEIGLKDDHFWYMISNAEPEVKRSRMDLLFNLALGIDDEAYKRDAFCAFSKFVENKNIYEDWKKVRQTYTRLRDLFENPVFYHYIGFLTFCNSSTNYLRDVLHKREEKSDNEFKSHLIELISKIIKNGKNSAAGYSYYEPKSKLRKLFVLHNIETILSRYETLHKNEQLLWSFEQFPFDLLNKHTSGWDIEHLASQTDNPLNREQDWEDWLKSASEDYQDLISNFEDIQDAIKAYEKKKSKENFGIVYRRIIEKIEAEQGDQKVINKDGIGNLVLLDSHTNRSFHNSLYPRKRRIILIADSNKEEEGVRNAYIPICTKQVFMKYYNKEINISVNAWTQDDYNAYEEDIINKLDNKFFK